MRLSVFQTASVLCLAKSSLKTVFQAAFALGLQPRCGFEGGVSTDDVQTILNLKNAWQYILAADAPFDWTLLCKINGFVAYNESLAWGEMRTGRAVF